MTQTFDVAIVGGGPVGLVVALYLERRGVSVVLFESALETAKEQRGAAFHPPTLEMLDQFGITTELLPIGVTVPVWQLRDREEVIAEFDLGVLADETAYPFRFHLPQHILSEALLRKLHGSRATLFHGCVVERFTVFDDAVQVHWVDDAGQPRDVRARWVVGADGAHSVTRKLAGIGFPGFSWPERFLVTNVAYPIEELGFCATAYVSDPERWAVVLKLADGRHPNLWRVAFPTDPDIPDADVLAPHAVQQRLRDVLREAGELPVVYSNTYRVHQRVADRFRAGRFLLAGDAAHINNPIGGFGLNGGVHDAFNLAERLAGVVKAGASDAELDVYARQRRYVAVEHVQAQSIRNKKQLEERDPAQRAAQKAQLRAIAAHRDKARSYLMETSMINSVRRAAEVA